MRKPYPTDLTDEQWQVLQPLIPPAKHGGRPRTVDMREVVNTLFYQNRSGCQWDMLPHDLLPKSTVYDYFAQWRDDGTWQLLLDALRRAVRQAAGRERPPAPGPSTARASRPPQVGGERGYDGGKKVTGRKRHIVVDTLGLLLAVAVTSAAADDGTAAPCVLEKLDPAGTPAAGEAVGRSQVPQPLLGPLAGGRGGALPDRSGAAAVGGERVRAVAPALGGGADVRLAGALPAQ